LDIIKPHKLLDQARICKMYIKHNAVISSV
jgi:hypothetical protein